jgi:nicotinate-nucleotide adenylyltransferase
MKRVGLLGGTFDPIHFGHLNLAFELMEKRNLEEVWFVPAQINPFKIESPPISIEHRLEMVKMAIEGIPQFCVKSIEKDRHPSYTFHTLQDFIEETVQKMQMIQFFLLMGEDSLPGFMNWYRAEEIVQMVPLLIGSRTGSELGGYAEWPPAVHQAMEAGLTETSLMDISGTQVRKRIKNGLYCGHLVPESVLKYIEKNLLWT